MAKRALVLTLHMRYNNKVVLKKKRGGKKTTGIGAVMESKYLGRGR